MWRVRATITFRFFIHSPHAALTPATMAIQPYNETSGAVRVGSDWGSQAWCHRGLAYRCAVFSPGNAVPVCGIGEGAHRHQVLGDGGARQSPTLGEAGSAGGEQPQCIHHQRMAWLLKWCTWAQVTSEERAQLESQTQAEMRAQYLLTRLNLEEDPAGSQSPTPARRIVLLKMAGAVCTGLHFAVGGRWLTVLGTGGCSQAIPG
jgi:hypothetical protein